MCNHFHVNQLDIGWKASDHDRRLQLNEFGDPDWEAKANASRPFGCFLKPAEVARGALLLASDDAVTHYDQSIWGDDDGQALGAAKKLTPL